MVATLNEIKSGVWNQTNMAPFLLVLTRCGENADPIINAASPILLIRLYNDQVMGTGEAETREIRTKKRVGLIKKENNIATLIQTPTTKSIQKMMLTNQKTLNSRKHPEVENNMVYLQILSGFLGSSG
ncbi:hypothetical protein YC2023_105016 [Brassica napus]